MKTISALLLWYALIGQTHKSRVALLKFSTKSHIHSICPIFNHKAQTLVDFLITGLFTSRLNPGIRRQSCFVTSGHPESFIPHVTNSMLDGQAFQWL